MSVWGVMSGRLMILRASALLPALERGAAQFVVAVVPDHVPEQVWPVVQKELLTEQRSAALGEEIFNARVELIRAEEIIAPERQHIRVPLDIELSDEATLAVHTPRGEVVGVIIPPLANLFLAVHVPAVGTDRVGRDDGIRDRLT